MRAIGLDIGTTTICAIVLDAETGAILETITRDNNSFIKTQNPWEKVQDVTIIINHIEKIVHELTMKYAPIGCIGLTGQMHGILYIDKEGNAVSPLYTWQDGRGDLDYKEDMSYAKYMSEKTGYKVATGFGGVTHFYNSVNGLVPKLADSFCTIHDYAAMKLSNTIKPLVHPSNAASIGFFDMELNDFDHQAISSSGLDDTLFPSVSQEIELLGSTESKIHISIAIGDNQASFLGAVKSSEDCLSINIGTSSQISMFTNSYSRYSEIETRPFAGDGFLVVGSPLCGGRAYALLESFFRSAVYMATGEETPKLYDMMEKFAYDFLSIDNKLEISTKFSGTRSNPSERGFINNIGIDNFTPQHFVVGVLEGISNELYSLYEAMAPMLSKKPTMIIGSGNAVRMNKPLQRMISNIFKMEISIPIYKEEAAYGSALFALVATGYFKNVSEAQKLIKYE